MTSPSGEKVTSRRPSQDEDDEDITSASQPDYESAEFESEVESHRLSLRGRKLTVALAFVTGTGFTLFG